MTPLQSWATIALLVVLVGLLVYIVAELEARVAERQQRNRSAEILAKPAHDPAIAPVHDIAAARARRTMLALPEDDDCPKSRSADLYDQTVDDL